MTIRVLQTEVDSQVGEYCGQCGKAIPDIPKYGIAWDLLPYLLFGGWVDTGKGADIIRAGEILIVPMCSRECQKKYKLQVKGVEVYA